MSTNKLVSDSHLLNKEKRKKKLFILIPLIFIFASLTILSIFYLDIDKPIVENIEALIVNEDINLEILSDEINTSNFDSLLNDQIDSTSNTATVIKNSIIDVYSLKEIQTNYLVIIGAFKDKENAIHLRDQIIQHLNPSCKVVFNNKSLFWVSLDFYDSIEEATKSLNDCNLDGWIKQV